MDENVVKGNSVCVGQLKRDGAFQSESHGFCFFLLLSNRYYPPAGD